jgi:tetratricopeptide (TPR) repeat protein
MKMTPFGFEMWEGLYAPTLTAASAPCRGVKPLPHPSQLAKRNLKRAGLCLAALTGMFFPSVRAADAPAPLLRAAAAETRSGEEAYLLGRADEAVPALREAARLYLAAGDLTGGVRALVNLALAERAAGDVAAARVTATRLRELTPAAQQQLAEQRPEPGEAGTELSAASGWLDALLALEQGDVAAAARLVPSSGRFPAASVWRARVATLQAAIFLAGGNPAEALAQAGAGQKASLAAGDRAEEARAWRLAGEAHLKLGQWPEARSDYLAAVKIGDGGGARLAGDLGQLAVIAGHLGDADGARLYTRRAAAITAARAR